MIRLAEQLRRRGLAAIGAAGFLNFSRPTLAEALQHCHEEGATAVTIQPYFLVAGHFVTQVLPKLAAEASADLPGLPVRLAAALGYHPALAELAWRRAVAPAKTPGEAPALLLLAHGTPQAAANAPIYRVAAALRERRYFRRVEAAFLECNPPGVPEALDQLIAAGHDAIVALPYFLQLGGHVAEDLPRLIRAARARHPQLRLYLAEHLGYHPLLLEVIAERLREAR